MLPGIGKHFQSRSKACPSFCPFRRFSSLIFLPVLVSTVFHQRVSVREGSIFPSMQFWLNPKLYRAGRSRRNRGMFPVSQFSYGAESGPVSSPMTAV